MKEYVLTWMTESTHQQVGECPVDIQTMEPRRGRESINRILKLVEDGLPFHSYP